MAFVLIKFQVDNAAFDEDFHGEVKEVLSNAASLLAVGHGGKLFDSNGNKIGDVSLNAEGEGREQN